MNSAPASQLAHVFAAPGAVSSVPGAGIAGIGQVTMGNRLSVVLADVTDGLAQRRLGYRGLTGEGMSDAHATHDPSIRTP